MSGNYLPRNTLVESLGHAMLKLSGWKIEGQLPALDKFVAVSYTHLGPSTGCLDTLLVAVTSPMASREVTR